MNRNHLHCIVWAEPVPVVLMAAILQQFVGLQAKQTKTILFIGHLNTTRKKVHLNPLPTSKYCSCLQSTLLLSFFLLREVSFIMYLFYIQPYFFK